MVSQKNAISKHFGYFPEFADALILNLCFENSSTAPSELSLTVYYLDAEQSKELKLKISLLDIYDLSFSDLFDQNVIDCLSITAIGSEQEEFLLEIEACAGLRGQCKSKSLEFEIIRMV